jgi:hypothetical protein
VAMIQSITECPSFPVVPGMEFRHCNNLPGYAADSDGGVWSCNGAKRSWKRMSPTISDRGYNRVSVYINNKLCTKKSATLVAEAFLCPRPKGMEVCHKDGNKRRDASSNLYWGTHQQNMEDWVRQGSYGALLPDDNPHTVIKSSEWTNVIRLYETHTQAEIAAMYGVRQTAISNGLRKRGIKRSRAHLHGPHTRKEWDEDRLCDPRVEQSA